LELDHVQAVAQLKAALREVPDLFPHLHTLSLRQPDEWSPEDLDLQMLPALTELFISNREGSYPVKSLLLPTSLVKLRSSFSKLPLGALQAWPASLTKLHLHLRQWRPLFHLLPRQLQDLRLTSTDSELDITLENWAALPLTLTSLDVTANVFPPESELSLLPPDLTKFHLNTPQDFELSEEQLLSVFQHLPSTIVKIGGFLPNPITKTIAAALPRRLKQSLYSDVPYDAISFLPDGIKMIFAVTEEDGTEGEATGTTPPAPTDNPIPTTYPSNLKVLYGAIAFAEEVRALPRGLLELHGKDNQAANMSQEFASALPPGLHDLTLDVQFYSLSQNVVHLPRTIRYLDLSVKSYEPDQTPLPASCASDLPPCLDHLWLHRIPVCPSFYSNLPKSLQMLSLESQSLPLDSLNSFTAFPSLRSLSIVTSHPPTLWRPFISSLPRKLHSFVWRAIPISLDWITELIDTDLANLPPGLRSISIPNSPAITAACMPHLPPSLQRLHLGLNPSWFSP
jgi:hypothetical protein